MTQKFKFGDLVRLKTDVVTGVVVRVGYQHIWIVFDGHETADVCKSEEFELIPHPDTVRLDWLARNDCALTERLCDEDGDRLDTPFAVIQKQEEHFEVLAAACDIRDAIDEAMQLTVGYSK